MISRFSSRRTRLDHSFLQDRLHDALAYDRIAGYFSSSLMEVAGEALQSVQGSIRVVCNSSLEPADIITAKAAQMAVRRSWCASQPEKLLAGACEQIARERFKRLHGLLQSGKLTVRVLPENAFGLIHGKAGVITLKDGRQTCFLGSANESKAAWKLNYELIWEDSDPEAIKWVQEEFDALWQSPFSVPLADFVIEDLSRLADRRTIFNVNEWIDSHTGSPEEDATPAVIETPVYRKEVGLWEHQKYFVQLVFESHQGPIGKARYVLADQVGLGKTLQLAMSGLLIALIGNKPILVICPKTLVWQWQGEMNELLEMPSAVWTGKTWIDENNIEHPAMGVEGILKCPRRVGIISSGLITWGSEAKDYLLKLTYDCVILDEAHRARRRNLGENRDSEAPDPNNLLQFMYQIAEKTKTLLLATATPVQLRPVEAWDLLDILSRGDDSVLGNMHSLWRRPASALDMIMERSEPPNDENIIWEWVRNPLPPKNEHHDFEILRRQLNVDDADAVVKGDLISDLSGPAKARLNKLFPRLVKEHNPFIRRIIRRTRHQLENQIDPETKEPLLDPISVDLFGESPQDAVRLPPYLREAYELAEHFCHTLGQRLKSAGFLKTLLLRRMGSSVYAGYLTAKKMLETWETIDAEYEYEDELFGEENILSLHERAIVKTLSADERTLLERLVAALQANQERDPKFDVVRKCLLEWRWLEVGCIIFSQYRDSIQWIAELLSKELPAEPIAVYSGPSTSGVMQDSQWSQENRDRIKKMIMSGELRLLLGTDAASEGINLQKLATLINLDLPWNPTRLEQRKGRIQRIGQIHDPVKIFNMRYKDSVEDRVHELLSERLHDIYNLFGQLPDVLEDAWVAVALGEKERAQKIIDAVPESHPFEIRYSNVEKINWESCRKVLDKSEKDRILKQKW